MQAKKIVIWKFTAGEMIKIVPEDIHGEDTIASICRKYIIHANNYFRWKKELIEAGIGRLSVDTRRETARDDPVL